MIIFLNGETFGELKIGTSFGAHSKKCVALHNLAHQGTYIKMEEFCILATRLKYLQR